MTMTVIPASPGRGGCKRITAMFMGRDVGRTLLVSAVHLGGNVESMPMDHLVFTRVVPNLDRQRLAFVGTQKRARHLAVVCHGLDGSPRPEFPSDFADVKRYVGLAFVRG